RAGGGEGARRGPRAAARGPGRRLRFRPHLADRGSGDQRQRRLLQAARPGLLDRAVRADDEARRPRFPPRGEPRARARLPHSRDRQDLRALARPARPAEPAAVGHLLHPGAVGMRFLLLAFFASAAVAQTCLVCGEIRGIREVSEVRNQEKTPEPVGTRSGLDTPPVVGTVAQFHFGAEKGDRWSFGAAGTPEMQSHLGRTYYEIT